LILAGLIHSAIAQHQREDQPLPDDLYELYQKRSEAIAEAIKNSKDEWAGTYLAGDHHPTVFILEPNAGFLVSSSNHTFAPSWINYGKVTITDSILRIRPELEKDHSSAHIMPTEFRLVRWGRQHFLLAGEEFRPFAWAVHARAESLIVQYFARAEDGKELRSGLPDLPSDFVTIMRMAPLTARVVAVGPEKVYGQTVTIAAGSDQRISEGMFLYYLKGGYQYSIRVTSVSARQAKGEVWSRANIGNELDGEVVIRVGQKLSSRMPKDFVEPG
jgi:hypothetical protein